jgi:hypothetical protein
LVAILSTRLRLPPSSTSGDLILTCIRYSLGAGSPQAVAESARDFQHWPAFLDTAEGHGLLPIVAACFDSCGIPAPDSVYERLGSALRQNAKRVLVMTEELTRLLGLLEAAGVPVLAIKGPVIANTLYADPAYRFFTDLDLLVPPARVPDARRILFRAGYEPSRSVREQSIFQFTELSLENPRTGVHVDLHWELTPKDWIASMPPGLWDRTRTVLVGGSAIPTLGEADTFLHLCVHGGKHGWTSLNWLVDLCSQILKSPGIAERSLELVNPRSEVAAMVRFGLAASAVVASEVVQAAGGPDSLAKRVVHERLSGVPHDETSLSRLRFQSTLGLPRFTIFRFAVRRLFIPNQDDWDTLPIRQRRLLFLLVPWRLLRLTWRLASGAVQRS